MSDITDPTVYILGTLLSGTDRQLENSVNGYNPVVCFHLYFHRFKTNINIGC